MEVPGKSEEEIALEQNQTPAGAEEIVKEEKANPDRVKCSACSKVISKDKAKEIFGCLTS